MIALGHRGWPKADAPAETTTAEPTTETPAEGSTPPTETPAPAQVSAHDSWVKRYGDPEKAATEAYALEQRVAAMAKRVKELEAQPPTTSPTEAQPSAPSSPQAPPAVQAQPATPESPAPTLEEQAINYALKHDEKCRDLIDKFNANGARLEALTTKEIPALQEEIRTSNALIAHPNVDELVKDEARQTLHRAEMNLAAREAKAAELGLLNRTLDMDFKDRVGGFVSSLEHQAGMRAREAEDERDAEAKAQEFVGHWPAAFDSAFKEQGIDPEMRADIHEAVKVLALARPGRIDLKDLSGFMKEAVKSEFQKVDKYHRIQARIHALKKNADTSPAAPTGTAAQASPATPTTEDPDKVTRNMLRDAIAARKGASIR